MNPFLHLLPRLNQSLNSAGRWDFVYVTGYDEVWFYVAPYQAGSAFDQNRAYVALGFSVKPDWRIETGYLNQTLLERTGRVLEVNYTVVISVYSTAALRRKQRKAEVPARQAVRQ